MKLNLALLTGFLMVTLVALAQSQEINFNVIFKEEEVGVLHARETTSGSRSFKVLTIETSTTFFFIPIHVESEVTTTQENGVLIEGTAYRNASRKSSDVIAKVTKTGDGIYERERNGVKDKISNQRITFCVIDLYFNEPTGIKRVFSNMYARMLRLKRIDDGVYQLITPDNKDSIYTYDKGKLVSIKIETPVGTVLSKRV